MSTSELTKRQHLATIQRSRKRRKIQGPERLHRTVERTSRKSTAVVGQDRLRWKAVVLPDRLEDAEGFFGLEEIEDVEVVKEAGNRHATFRALQQEVLMSRDEDGAPDYVTAQYEEWAGFGDEEDDTMSRSSRPPRPLTSTTEPKNATAVGGTKTGTIEARDFLSIDGDGLEVNIPYTALGDVSDEDPLDVAWTSLGLSEVTNSALSRLGFSRPTPIQSAAIPKILEGRDVIGKAVTGSGKTLAYGIPIFERWLSLRQKSKHRQEVVPAAPAALVLSPTRELAHQLSKHISQLVQASPESLRVVTITGGLSIHKQLRQLANADIIIGTPGRLWEVMSESSETVAKLKQIKFLVIDEADRLLSEGHFQELGQILDALDRNVIDEEAQALKIISRQTLVFSATFHKGLQQKLAAKRRPERGELLDNRQSMEYLLERLSFREERPTFIDVDPVQQMARKLNEQVLECGALEKDLYVYYLLLRHPNEKVLIFANSIASVKRLTNMLQNLELSATALHSTMTQRARLRSLERFQGQHSKILIATDVAARGLDIKNINLIIHYHVPRTADMYIHRSGRTARAGDIGRSILLCAPAEVQSVTRLIAKVHKGRVVETMYADRGIMKRLETRLALSQKLTEATGAKEQTATRDDWLRNAAEELGVDYDSDEFAVDTAKNSRGRFRKEEVAGATQLDILALRTQLKGMLRKRINLGVSERYLAGGQVDVNALLSNKNDGTFLGRSEV